MLIKSYRCNIKNDERCSYGYFSCTYTFLVSYDFFSVYKAKHLKKWVLLILTLCYKVLKLILTNFINYDDQVLLTGVHLN